VYARGTCSSNSRGRGQADPPDLRGETHLRAWMLREAARQSRSTRAHHRHHDIGRDRRRRAVPSHGVLVGTRSLLSWHTADAAERGVESSSRWAQRSLAHDLGVVHRDLKSDNILRTHRGGSQRFREDLGFRVAAWPTISTLGARRGLRHPRIHVARTSRAARGGPHSGICTRSASCFRNADRQLRSGAGVGHAARDAAHGARPRRPAFRKDVTPWQSESCCACSRRIRASATATAIIAGRAEGLPAFAASASGRGRTGESAPAHASTSARARALSSGPARGLFARMVARAYPRRTRRRVTQAVARSFLPPKA